MQLQEHRLSHATFATISRGAASRDALRELTAARHSRDLVLLRTMVELAVRRRHPAAVVVANAFRRLVDLERVAPAAVAATLHYPSVASWMLRTVHNLASADPTGARPGFLAAVVAAAVVRGQVPADLDLTEATAAANSGTVVTLPSVGTALLPAGPVQLRVTTRGAELSGGDVRVDLPRYRDGQVGEQGRWAAVPIIVAEHLGLRVELRLDAFDGFAGGGEFDHELMASESRDPCAIAYWQDRLAQAWPLLVVHHHELATELTALLTVLAPMRPAPDGFAAGTPHDAFGCVAMSRPHDATELALNLAHEIQHVKLTAVTDLFSMAVASGGRFYAPWRDEPRPLLGVLHGVYAHLGVVAFWRRRRQVLTGAAALHAHIQFSRWRSAAAETGRELLASGWLTAIGTEFVKGVVDILDGWKADPVPAEAVVIADRLNVEHRTVWRGRFGAAATERSSTE